MELPSKLRLTQVRCSLSCRSGLEEPAHLAGSCHFSLRFGRRATTTRLNHECSHTDPHTFWEIIYTCNLMVLPPAMCLHLVAVLGLFTKISTSQ